MKSPKTRAASQPRDGFDARPRLEWWFVHGSYAAPRRPPSHFMTAVFKQDFFFENGKAKGGFSRIEAFLDEEDGTIRTDCRIDRRLLGVARSLRAEEIRLNADPRLIQAFLEEIQTGGPPREVRASSDRITFHAAPLRIDWDGFSLREREDGFSRSFLPSNDGGTAGLSFDPRSTGDSRSGRPELGGAIRLEMSYRTFPRLTLRHGPAFGSERPGSIISGAAMTG